MLELDKIMRAGELMIGDYVMYNKYIYIIEEISSKGWVHIADPNTKTRVPLTSDYIISTLEPIPLTPEILEKNGFELQRDKGKLFTLDTYWLGSELGAFRIHRLNNGDYQFGLAKIRNVHELQHALRLCGIDKEIEI